MFSVGQKVVLVDDAWPETVKQLYLALPVKDGVYVVRAVRVGVKADELIMDLRRVLFVGGDAGKLASVQIRCVEVAKRLGCDYHG